MPKHLLLGLLLAPALASAQTPITYTIKGTVAKINAPTKIYLVRGGQLLDSAAFQGGTFELKGRADMPKEVELVVPRRGYVRDAMSASWERHRTRLFLESGTIVVTSPDTLTTVTLKGGPVTADFQRLQQLMRPLDNQRQTLEAEFMKTPEAQRQSPEFTARAQAQGQALFAEYARAHAAFVKANPNSWVSLESLQAMRMLAGSLQYREVAPLYAALSPSLKNTAPGREFGEMLQVIKSTSIGAQAPDFRQTTPDGKVVTLADYRGKYVLVDFWASWCGPCRQENPNVLQAYHAFKGRRFEVLSISLNRDQDRAKWLKAIEEDHLPWTQASDLKGMQNEAALRYNVQAIPQNFLIDPNGKIVASNLRGDNLQKVLAEHLK